MGTDDPIGRVEELARLGGFERLRDFGVPESELEEVAEARGPAGREANPRPATLPHSSSFCALCGSGPTRAFPPTVHGSHRTHLLLRAGLQAI